MSLSLPRTFANRYVLDRPIGDGAFSRTYLATDTVLQRQVAVKILRREYVDNEEFAARFDREAHAAARVSHPNVVTVYDVGRQDGLPFIVMQYVDGPSLKEYVRDEGPLTVEEAVKITVQILDGLAAIHAGGIVHRDVKPQNILLDANRVAKLTDFGVAFLTHQTGLTETGMALGTAAYMAPEQASGDVVGPQTDLYAVGVILYELLTGRLPFRGDNPVQLMYRHVSELPPAPRQFNRYIPMSTESVVLRALAKVPSDRFPDAMAMRRALTGAAQVQSLPREPRAVAGQATTKRSAPSQPRQTTPPPPVGPPTQHGRSAGEPYRRGWPILLIALALLLVAAAATYLTADSLGLLDTGGGLAQEEQPAGLPSVDDPTATEPPVEPSPTATTEATEPAPAVEPPEPTATPPPTPTVTPTPVPPTATATVPPTATLTEEPDDDEEDGQGPDSGRPPVAEFDKPRSANSIPRSWASGPSTTFGRDDLAAGGAYERDDGRLYNRPTAHLYGQGSGYDTTTVTFNVNDPPTSYIGIEIIGMDDELKENVPMRISLNGNVVWEGESPFGDEKWTDMVWVAGNLNWLVEGENSLTIELLIEGEVGLPPWVLINEATVYWG